MKNISSILMSATTATLLLGSLGNAVAAKKPVVPKEATTVPFFNAFNYKNGLNTSVNLCTLMLNVSIPLATLSGAGKRGFSGAYPQEFP